MSSAQQPAMTLAKPAGWRFWAPPVLVLAVLVLYPFARAAELPMAIMALMGLGLLIARWDAFWNTPGANALALVFLCWWGPVVLSAADSAAPAESWRVVASLPRYFLVGVFVLMTVRTANQWRMVAGGAAVLLGVWVIDALVQALLGFNLLAMPRPERLNGVFGMDHLKLGPVLAVLLPLLIECSRQRWPNWLRITVLLAALVVVLLTGTRAAWLMVLLLMAIYVYRSWRANPRRGVRLALILLVGAALTGVGLYQVSDGFKQRVNRTLRVLDADVEGVDTAISSRLPIWQTSLEMYLAHPINGVGVRAFRDDYAVYSSPGDPWVDRRGRGGALYAHHYLLEIISETGTIGLLAFALLVGTLVNAWSTASRAGRQRALPFGLALILAAFPLNTHYAIYSTFWSLLLWWLIAAYLGALNAGESASKDTHPAATSPEPGPGNKEQQHG